MAKKIDLDGLEHFKQKENASIAGTESSSTASKAYKVGEYFYFKGTLVICTVDIASGGTITLNTNCKTVPLAQEVSDLKTASDAIGVITGKWEHGQINASNGKNVNSDYAIRSSYIPLAGHGRKIKVLYHFPTNSNVEYYRVYVIEYSGESVSTFINGTTFTTQSESSEVILKNSTNYIRLCIRPYPDSSTIVPLDGYKYITVYFNDGDLGTIAENVKKTTISTLLGDNKKEIQQGISVALNLFVEEQPILLNQSGSIVDGTDIYTFTDYIKCDKYIGFEINGNSTRIVAYFYTYNNGSYTLTWNVLNYTTSDNKKNYFGANAYNKVIEVPNYENTYVRYAIAVGNPENVKVYLWNGEHIGCDISGLWRHVDTTDGSITRSTQNFNMLGSYLPNNIKTLFCKDILIMDVYGFNFVDGTPTGTQLLTDAYVQVYSPPKGYDYFMVNFALCEENSRSDIYHATTQYITASFELNDYVSSIVDFTTYDTLFGKAKNLLVPINQISTVPWTCKNETSIYTTGTFFLHKNYAGVPYSSKWTAAFFFGWHITKHTFVNAANDSRSIFYLDHGRNGRGTGYGLVCSAFASLVTGSPYPLTTYALLDDPQVQHEFTLQPKVGTIMYNANGHCLLMLGLGGGQGYKSYTLAEGINPTTAYRVNYDFMLDTDSDNNAYNWNYINPYVYSCMHTKATGTPQVYNIIDGEIVNGSARPYRGDRSVYTSDMDVRINIKDDTAETLYYQKCTYSDGTFTLTGSASSVAINGATYIDLDKTSLEDNSFYAVWTDADSVKEYFEYHDITAQTYALSNGNITFSDTDFWYALWWQGDTENSKTAIVPKLENGDYSEYVEAYSISGEVDGYLFYKGTLGAYVVPLNVST